MTRQFSRCCAVLLLALATAPHAWAHGGPLLPSPPGMPPPPKPDVPFMPPPPPGTPPPAPITPPDKPVPPPTLPTTPPALPTTPPGSLPPTTPAPGSTPTAPEAGPTSGRARPWLARRPAGAGAGESAGDWQAWWLLARAGMLPDREEARRRAPLGEITPGEPGVVPPDVHERAREGLCRAVALPLLRRLAGPGERSGEVRASALIALARLSTGPETVDLMLVALFEERAEPIVRESAALGLGLLRRTRADLRATPGDLERARDALLYALDDERVPDRARAFAAFGLGLLGDQPAVDAGVESDVGLVPAIWSRFARPHASRELPVALLTALGAQRPKVLPDGVRDGLRTIVLGRPALGRRFSDVERSHALTALARLAPQAAASDVLRALARQREAPDVLRAAAIALGAHAAAWSPDQRSEALPVALRALDAARDPFTRGLIRLALGRLLGADLAAGGPGAALASSVAPRRLLAEADNAPLGERGFAVLALALAARPVVGAPQAPAWVEEAYRLLRTGMERASTDDEVRSAYAVALGMLGDTRSCAHLLQVVSDRDQPLGVRGHGAVAVGQLGAQPQAAARTLVLLLSERRREDLRAQAALALSFLGSREALPVLLREAHDPDLTEHMLAQVAVALGRLGSVQASGALAALADDASRGENSRALAVVALGLVLDPEPRSSLLRLALDANYPARTTALHELLTIL